MVRDTNIRAHCCGTEDVEDEAVELRQFLDVVEPALEADGRPDDKSLSTRLSSGDRTIQISMLSRASTVRDFGI